MGLTLPSCSVTAHMFWVFPKLALSRECPEQPSVFVHQATEKGTRHFTGPCFAGTEQAWSPPSIMFLGHSVPWK